MKTICFITGNKNKFLEANKIILNLSQLDLDLPEIQEINPKKVIEAKLFEALKYKDTMFVVEDTSLYLDCLNGLPGPLIKWFSKTIGNIGLYNLAKKYNNFNAKAKTYVGYLKNKNEIHYFEGSVKGKIVYPKGENDFGWGPIFRPENSLKTFAELTKGEKNKISMRRIAFEKLNDFLNNKKK